MGKNLNVSSSLWISFDNHFFLSPADGIKEFEAEVRLFAQAAKIELS